MKKVLFLLSCFLFFWYSFASVPSYYIANYQIDSDLEKIENALIDIDANSNLWVEIERSVFLDFYNWLDSVQSYLPQDYSFQVVYNQCLTLSKSLSQQYNLNTFISFTENCQRSFESILNQIDAQYTVIASASANPSSWPAPLTVTFDARSSVDPSNQTIPSENFYWYYRDTDWNDQIIWEWPVISYEFKESWNYVVHLTVRSSNYRSEWIFDWSDSLSVDVTPKSAIISVYANSQKLNSSEKIKFWSTEASRWIVFDGSSTIPMWWRELMSHSRRVVWWSINFSKSAEWTPGLISIPITEDWEYRVTLETTDNESNKISETYTVVVSDPVAIINQTPETWNTSNTYTFDSNWSYSVTSAIKLYTREVFDDEWTKLNTTQNKRLQFQFKEPWNYTVKLSVEDELWKSNIETAKVFVESTAPIAQFSVEPSINLQYPSEFTLDASLSSDVDVDNELDSLTYERKFSDTNNTQILQTENGNQKIKVAFDRIWTNTATLIVKDEYGQISEISKDIKVESTLRPEIYVSKKATTRDNSINFVATVNDVVYSYERDFDDWETRTIQTNTISHKFSQVWQYNVSLTVYGENNTENTVTEKIFIWDKNRPIPAYDVKNNNSEILESKDTCTEIINWETIEHNAYQVDRYQTFFIDPSDSVNTKWLTNDLKYYFQPRNWEIYTRNTYNSSFDELWCTFIDFTLEDTQLWVSETQRIWFKTYNQLPTLDSLVLYFPQYGNEMWIWFQENTVKDIFNTEYDPLLVKVQANNAYDWDWFISYYKRYYYYKDDPSRKLETKISPGDIPNTYFSLPKTPWEFMFWVSIYDSDDWEIASEEILWNWPVVFFPADTKRPDIPIVTVKVDKNSVDIWEEVTFDVISKVISDSDTFEQERTIQYDFDWDGTRDQITKSDRVTHIYTKANPYWYQPRVAVLYRWYKWVWDADTIIVKEWLKPSLLYANDWNFVLFRDVSFGNIESTEVCTDVIQCARGNTDLIMENPNQYFTYEYDDFWKYFVSIAVTDQFANEVKNNFPVELIDKSSNQTWDHLAFLSIPKATENTEGNLDIIVGNNLDNSILYYVKWEWEWECYVDLNTSDDSEKDFECNTMYFKEYNPNFVWTKWKLYYTQDWIQQTKDINVSFLDYDIEITQQQTDVSDKISSVINQLDTSVSANQSLVELLLTLQQWLLDEKATQANVVSLQDFLDNDTEYKLEPGMDETLNSIITSLSDSTVISWLGWSEYMQAKSEILTITPYNLKPDIEPLFFQLESSDQYISEDATQKENQKMILQNIINSLASAIATDTSSQNESQITQDDMDYIIVPNICIIANYYQVVTELCASWDDNIQINTETVENEQVWMSGFLKWTLIILWIVFGIFIGLIVVFAIKAKLRNNTEEDEE